MNRKRRHACRVVEMKKLDRPVLLAGYAQDSENWREWMGRRVSARTALEMVSAGEAQELYRQTENGVISIYRETGPTRASKASPAMLTLSTMLAVSGEIDRRSEVEKYAMWPFEFDRRNAATVGPAVGYFERQRAQQILNRARGIRVPNLASIKDRPSVRTWHALTELAA